MKHSIVYKRPGYYSMGPVPRLLSDGRLAVGLISSPFADHYGLADWMVVVSGDQGETFEETADQTIPLAWPGSNTRERYDRFAGILADGTCLATGTVGFEVWSKDRREEAVEAGLSVGDHPSRLGEEIVVGMPKMFVQRSQDGGQTWERREWFVPGFRLLTAFPRWTHLEDGTILLPVYGTAQEGSHSQTFAWRSDRNGDDWRLFPISSSVSGVNGNETCFLEAEPGRVLALIRHGTEGQLARDHLLESWSEDGGITWSQPLGTQIKGYPPHLLRLQDGRLLCCVTYRWEPMGVRAVLSEDNGRTWDVEHTIVLRDDAGTVSTLRPNHPTRRGGSDVGYPVTVQFQDGTLFTCYWITLEDGITHIAATRWRTDEI